MLRLHSALKSSRAAIDLASIMVGIIIIGLIGGVIAATVFAVIPWSQDKAAKQQLDNVSSAESAYRGLSADKDSKLKDASATPTNSSDANQVVLNSTFTGSDGLAINQLLEANPANYCVLATDNGKDYAAYARSGSGKVFKSTSKGFTGEAANDEAICLTPTAGGNGGNGSVSTPTGPTGTSDLKPTTAMYSNVSVSDDGSVIIGTAPAGNGAFYISKDGGNTWSSRTDSGYALNAVVSGDGKKVYYTYNANNRDPSYWIYSGTPDSRGSSTGAELRQYSYIYTSATGSSVLGLGTYVNATWNSTVDTGSNWSKYNYANVSSYVGGAMSQNGKVMAYLGSSGLYVSTDGTGKNFASRTIPAGETLTSTNLSNDGSVMTLTSSQGNGYVSQDKGVTWTKIAKPASVTGALQLSVAKSGRILMHGSTDSKLYVSDDAGATFNEVSGIDATGWTMTRITGNGDKFVASVGAKFYTGTITL